MAAAKGRDVNLSVKFWNFPAKEPTMLSLHSDYVNSYSNFKTGNEIGQAISKLYSDADIQTDNAGAKKVKSTASPGFPVLLLHGDKDRHVPCDHGQALTDMLEAHHVNVTFTCVKGANHFFSSSKHMRKLIASVNSMLDDLSLPCQSPLQASLAISASDKARLSKAK